MQLRHILAATDESDAGRQAVRTAVNLAYRGSACVTVVRVVAVEVPRFAGVTVGAGSVEAENDGPTLKRLRQWLEADVLCRDEAIRVQLGVAFGIPGIEICRFAEQGGADLVVLGRKRHSPRARLLLGDTADAVARRSRFPSLFVPSEAGELRRVLVALDGSERGMNVLHQACGFARSVGASLQVVTVEHGPTDEPWHLAPSLPLARSSSLQARAREMLSHEGLPDMGVAIRPGDVFDGVLAAVREMESDVLVIGYHRGGPPGIIEAGSTARRLAHAAPCAVLTIPL